jgi:NADH-quinone oxidoreductase subunit N
MGDLWRLIPEYLVLAGALVALFAEAARLGRRGAAAVGALAAAAAGVVAIAIGPGGALFGGRLALDETAVFARAAVALLTAVWVLWVLGRGTGDERPAEAVSFALLSLLGGMLIIAARDLVVLFISLELSTMPAYVLMGYRRVDERGLEGALKYFLLSMLTSLVLLYGLSFAYGIAGTTAYAGLTQGAPGLLRSLAFVFVLVGLFAKLSAAPFHYWTPDAYAGAPATSVAFVSTVPKVAGTIAAVHLVGALAPGVHDGGTVLLAAAVLSMLLGNFAAYPQSDLRRLMAYSGVAHTGYILLALAAGRLGGAAAAFYAVAYAVPSMAIMLVAAEEGPTLTDLAGLAERRPAAAWAFVVWLLSLVGIPPMVGFFGKLYIFTSAVDAGLTGAVVLAVVMSVVSAGYYLRVLREVFFGQREATPALEPSPAASVALLAATIAVLALGLAAAPVLAFIGLAF